MNNVATETNNNESYDSVSIYSTCEHALAFTESQMISDLESLEMVFEPMIMRFPCKLCDKNECIHYPTIISDTKTDNKKGSALTKTQFDDDDHLLYGPDIPIMEACLYQAAGRKFPKKGSGIPSLAFLAALSWVRHAAKKNVYILLDDMPSKLKTYLRMIIPLEENLHVISKNGYDVTINLTKTEKQFHWNVYFTHVNNNNSKKFTWTIQSEYFGNGLFIKNTPSSDGKWIDNIQCTNRFKCTTLDKMSSIVGIEDFGKAPFMKLFSSRSLKYIKYLNDQFPPTIWTSPNPRILIEHTNNKVPVYAQCMLNIIWERRNAPNYHRQRLKIITETNLRCGEDTKSNVVQLLKIEKKFDFALIWLIKQAHISLLSYDKTYLARPACDKSYSMNYIENYKKPPTPEDNLNKLLLLLKKM